MCLSYRASTLTTQADFLIFIIIDISGKNLATNGGCRERHFGGSGAGQSDSLENGQVVTARPFDQCILMLVKKDLPYGLIADELWLYCDGTGRKPAQYDQITYSRVANAPVFDIHFPGFGESRCEKITVHSVVTPLALRPRKPAP